MHLTSQRPSYGARTLVAACATALVTLLLTAVGLVALGASPAAAADDDVAWAVRTASNAFGSDRQNYRYTVNPGGHLQDGLVVTNHGRKPIRLQVYAADGFTTDSGQLDLVTRDATSTAVGAWTHADVSHVRIKGGDSVRVPFTVAVPENAPPGDYLGGIITSLTQPDDVQGINVDRRLAVRIRLRVGGDLTPGLQVENLHVDYSGTANPFGKGDATISYTIHNTGNAILSAHQSVSLSGPFGLLDADPAKIDDSPELLPGDEWKVSVPVHDVAPAGRLTGTATLVPLLTDASGSVSPLAAVDSSTHAWTLPWALILVLLVVVAIAVAALLVRRRRRLDAKAREDARVQEAVAQALREQHLTGK